jgi:hypothetical protein
VCPALFAYRVLLAVYEDVEFYVFAVAVLLPRVFTVFHSFISYLALLQWKLLLRRLKKQQYRSLGRGRLN